MRNKECHVERIRSTEKEVTLLTVNWEKGKAARAWITMISSSTFEYRINQVALDNVVDLAPGESMGKLDVSETELPPLFREQQR